MLHHNTFVVCKQKTSNLLTYLVLLLAGYATGRRVTTIGPHVRQFVCERVDGVHRPWLICSAVNSVQPACVQTEQ